MAKQTFTTGQVLTAAQMTSLQQTAMLGGAASAKTASYVLVAADAGDAITMSNAGATTITVNTGLFATGDIVTIINIGAGACTITAGTATVTTSGSLVLAQNQGGVLRFTSPSEAIFLQFATPASGDIEGVTAGVGISGGGTSGTVTVTNSMATAIDAKGDLVAGTGADTFARLGVGANDTVLTADSTAATGLKWAAAGGSLTWTAQNAGGTNLSGSATTISGISNKDYIQVIVQNAQSSTANVQVTVTINGDSSGYYILGTQMFADSSYTASFISGNNAYGGSRIQLGATSNNAGSVLQGGVYITGGKSTGSKSIISSGAAERSGSTGQVFQLLQGIYTGSAAISSITVNCEGGSFNGGKVYVWCA